MKKTFIILGLVLIVFSISSFFLGKHIGKQIADSLVSINDSFGDTIAAELDRSIQKELKSIMMDEYFSYDEIKVNPAFSLFTIKNFHYEIDDALVWKAEEINVEFSLRNLLKLVRKKEFKEMSNLSIGMTDVVFLTSSYNYEGAEFILKFKGNISQDMTLSTNFMQKLLQENQKIELIMTDYSIELDPEIYDLQDFSGPLEKLTHTDSLFLCLTNTSDVNKLYLNLNTKQQYFNNECNFAVSYRFNDYGEIVFDNMNLNAWQNLRVGDEFYWGDPNTSGKISLDELSSNADIEAKFNYDYWGNLDSIVPAGNAELEIKGLSLEYSKALIHDMQFDEAGAIFIPIMDNLDASSIKLQCSLRNDILDISLFKITMDVLSADLQANVKLNLNEYDEPYVNNGEIIFSNLSEEALEVVQNIEKFSERELPKKEENIILKFKGYLEELELID